MPETTTQTDRHPDNLATAASIISNTTTTVRDRRTNAEDEPLPETLYERVGRALTDALTGYQTHPKKYIVFTVTDADPAINNAEVAVNVELVVKHTPNVLNYLANKHEQVAFMGADVADGRHPGHNSIPDGWMRVKYRFYTPKTDGAFTEDDDRQFPPLDD